MGCRESKQQMQKLVFQSEAAVHSIRYTKFILGKKCCSVLKAYVKQVFIGQLQCDFIWKRHSDLDRNEARTGQGGNKERTYRTVKQEYGSETYTFSILPIRHRNAYTKLRCGLAPIRLETGRYERLPIVQRACFHCTETVESEEHVLINCPLYEAL